MKKFLFLTIISQALTIHTEPSEVRAKFVNEDSSPATVIIRTATHEAKYTTGRKESSTEELVIPIDATITIQGKGIGERSFPASMLLNNSCCVISSVPEPGGQGRLALAIQFYPHKACVTSK